MVRHRHDGRGRRHGPHHPLQRQAQGSPLRIRSLQAGGCRHSRKLRKEIRLERYQCTTLLSPQEYQVLQVDAINVPPGELRAAVRWRIKDLLNYHVDDASVDVLQIPWDRNAGSRPQSMYAVAAPNETIQRRVSLFEEAKIPLSVIDIPEMAQRNIAAFLSPRARAWRCCLSEPMAGCSPSPRAGSFIWRGASRFRWGTCATRMKNLRRQHFDRVTLEIQRSLDHFDRQFHYVTLNKLLLAPLPDDVGLREHLKANLYVTVETLDLAQGLDVSGVPDLRMLKPRPCSSTCWGRRCATRRRCCEPADQPVQPDLPQAEEVLLFHYPAQGLGLIVAGNPAVLRLRPLPGGPVGKAGAGNRAPAQAGAGAFRQVERRVCSETEKPGAGTGGAAARNPGRIPPGRWWTF